MKNSIPLVVFILLVVLFAVGLKLNPREVPSPLIDKPAPGFQLPRLYSSEINASPDKMKGRVWLLNVWASWCGACRAEHSVINKMVSKHHVEVVGLNYKDDNMQAKQWLRDHGNPYSMIAVDREGLAGIDWGVYGVPETFVIDKQGVIRYKSIGPVTHSEVEDTLIPLINKLQQEDMS